MRCTFPCLEKLAVFLIIALFVLTASAAQAGGAQVQVCHIPPGDPSNFHTITISENALPAHLAHGDIPGSCFASCDKLCNDGNPCTIDACDPVTEQCLSTHPPVNCDDGSLCTTDSCDPAVGCVNVAKTCADGDLCTIDSCDPLSGQCVFPPVVCSTGEKCDSANGGCKADACVPNPCVHGVCLDPPTTYTCVCDPGWTGTNCDEPTCLAGFIC